MSSSLFSLTPWTPSTLPTKTVFSTVNPTQTSGLDSLISNAIVSAATETFVGNLISLQQVVQGAQASMSIASAAQVTATATDQTVIEAANQVIFNSSLYLQYKYNEDNIYKYDLIWAPNIIYTILFGVAFFFMVGMLWKSRYHWFNICFVCGIGLEFCGFVMRLVSVTDPISDKPYIGQMVTLTIAPAFIMGGIYFLFAQLVVIHGRQYSILKPMWYSYIFIASDILSLLIQAAGGGAASAASTAHKDPQTGVDMMIAGICFQVFSMTVFVYFLIQLLYRLYFKHSKELNSENGHPLSKPSILNFIKLCLNFPSTREYRMTKLEGFYNPKYSKIRFRKLYAWYPGVLSVSVVLIYIRCIYRVVELVQGFRGWLITREWPLMVLDASMMVTVALLFIPFHPVFVLGTEEIIRVSTIKQNADELVHNPSEGEVEDEYSMENRSTGEEEKSEDKNNTKLFQV